MKNASSRKTNALVMNAIVHAAAELIRRRCRRVHAAAIQVVIVVHVVLWMLLLLLVVGMLLVLVVGMATVAVCRWRSGTGMPTGTTAGGTAGRRRDTGGGLAEAIAFHRQLWWAWRSNGSLSTIIKKEHSSTSKSRII